MRAAFCKLLVEKSRQDSSFSYTRMTIGYDNHACAVDWSLRDTYTIPNCSSVMADSKLHFMRFRFCKAFVTFVSLVALFQECMISGLQCETKKCL